MSFAEGLAQATAASVCNWLNSGGSSLAATFIGAGTFFPPTSAAARGAALGLLALDYGCSFNPNSGVPNENYNGFIGCTQAPPGGYLTLHPVTQDGRELSTGAQTFLSISMAKVTHRDAEGIIYDLDGVGSDGVPVVIRGRAWRLAGPPYNLKANPVGGACAGAPPQFGGSLPPRTFVTNEGCTLNVDFESWLMGPDGMVKPVVKISSATAPFASGGVVGGCYFEPIVYVGGGGSGGDPPWWAPWVPTPPGSDGKPWWLKLLESVGDAAMEAVIGKVIEDLMEPALPEVKYTLASVCEVDADGLATQRYVERTIPAGRGLPAIAQRIDMLQYIAQGLKDFRQPTCPREDTRPRFTGEEVTVRFESKEPSPYSAMRLRKNLRYRRQNGTDLAYHTQAWWNFEWRSGSCQVISTGLPWGRPQVWASTEAEGKRVIRRAADLAGVNLEDPRHKWVVNRSTDPRTGVAGEMKTKLLADGQPWVTERLGPDGPPFVALALPHDP
jgi:hypothetical protein